MKSTKIILGIACILSVQTGWGALQTWNGSVSGDWNVAANWTPPSGPPVVPTTGDSVVFPGGVPTSIFDVQPFTINGPNTFLINASLPYTIGQTGPAMGPFTFDSSAVPNLQFEGAAGSSSIYTPIIISGATTLTVEVDNALTSSLLGSITEIAGAGAINKTGNGTLTLGSPNTYTGGTTISQGALQANAAGATFTGDFVIGTLNGATNGELDLNGYSNTINSLSGYPLSSSTVIFGAAPALLTINGSLNTTYNGIFGYFGDTGAFTLSGSGSLTVTGTGAFYQGQTIVESTSTFIVNTELESSQVTVTFGATIGGNGTLDGNLMIDSGGFVSPGTSSPPTYETLTIHGSYTQQGTYN